MNRSLNFIERSCESTEISRKQMCDGSIRRSERDVQFCLNNNERQFIKPLVLVRLLEQVWLRRSSTASRSQTRRCRMCLMRSSLPGRQSCSTFRLCYPLLSEIISYQLNSNQHVTVSTHVNVFIREGFFQSTFDRVEKRFCCDFNCLISGVALNAGRHAELKELKFFHPETEKTVYKIQPEQCRKQRQLIKRILPFSLVTTRRIQ